MIKLEKIETYGWLPSFRGLRNPLSSWEKNDSVCDNSGYIVLGPNDLKLSTKLVKAGAYQILKMIL